MQDFKTSKILTSSILKPTISVNQIALQRKSWLYARGILESHSLQLIVNARMKERAFPLRLARLEFKV